MSDQTRLHIEAEARFLRAFLQRFMPSYNNGSVIIHTSVPEVRSDFYKFSSAQEVFSLIKSDLEFSYLHLPKSYNADEDQGRATGAAAAMLGKLHINEHNMILQKLILRLF